MSFKTTDEILNQVFDSDDNALKAVYKTEGEVLNLVYDETASALKVKLYGLTASGEIADHGALTGLSDDDHPQYINNVRGDARYSPLAHNHDSAYSPVAHNHDSAYSAASHTHADKQDVLISGTNIKTVNGASLLGTGDIVIEGSGGSAVSVPSGINYVINGNFDIWQRGTVQTANGYGSDDRWMNQSVSSTKTHSRIECTDTERAFFNASFFSRTAVTSVSSAAAQVQKQQRIEDVTKLAGKTVTLSFWAKSDAPKNMAVDFMQFYGTGGTPSAQTAGIGAQQISLTDQWQHFELTVALPAITGKTLGTDGVHTSYTALFFWFDAGTDLALRTAGLGQQSGIFDIAQVQLEEGSSATAFKHRHMAEEMALCQRYYEALASRASVYSGYVASGSVYYSYYPFKEVKRVTPSIVLTHLNAAAFPASAGTVSGSPHGFSESRTGNGTNTGGFFFSAFTADAEL